MRAKRRAVSIPADLGRQGDWWEPVQMGQVLWQLL